MGLGIPQTWTGPQQQDTYDATLLDSYPGKILDDIIKVKSSQSQLGGLSAEEAAELGDRAAEDAARALAETLAAVDSEDEAEDKGEDDKEQDKEKGKKQDKEQEALKKELATLNDGVKSGMSGRGQTR